MEAPEYLDLDEIDFSDDSVVSVIQKPFLIVASLFLSMC